MAPRIAVAVPTHEHVPADWAYDLAQLMNFSRSGLDRDTELGLIMMTGTYVHRARQDLAEAAIMSGTTHILWVDSDMRFPRSSLLRLLSHNVPIVGCNYAKREVPTDYVATVSPTEKLVTRTGDTGLVPVEAVGFGLLLMETRVLRTLPTTVPWFAHGFGEDPHTQDVGEDVYFCRLLREHGHEILVDQELSQFVGHIGSWEFKTEHVQMQGDL